MINPKAKSHLKNHSWPWLSFSRDILQNKNIFFDVECFPLANLEACVFDYSFVCICSHVLIAYLESFFAKWSWLLTFSNMPIFRNLADYYFFIAAQHLVPPYDIKKKFKFTFIFGSWNLDLDFKISLYYYFPFTMHRNNT